MARKRGRPRLDPNDATVGVQVRMPARMFDQLYKAASVNRCSMPEVMRLAIRRLLRAPEPPGGERK